MPLLLIYSFKLTSAFQPTVVTVQLLAMPQSASQQLLSSCFSRKVNF